MNQVARQKPLKRIGLQSAPKPEEGSGPSEAAQWKELINQTEQELEKTKSAQASLAAQDQAYVLHMHCLREDFTAASELVKTIQPVCDSATLPYQ